MTAVLMAALVLGSGLPPAEEPSAVDDEWTIEELAEVAAAEFAALATPAGPEPGLDVERLATAYANAEATIRSGHNRCEQFWDVFAREYAALQPTPSEETT